MSDRFYIDIDEMGYGIIVDKLDGGVWSTSLDNPNLENECHQLNKIVEHERNTLQAKINDYRDICARADEEMEKATRDLIALRQRVAELEAERDNAVRYSANLADAIRQHLLIWNHICDANRQENAVILATDTNQAMLDTLDSVAGNFSMVWVSDAFTPLQNVLDGKDSYFIKLYKELLEEQLSTD